VLIPRSSPHDRAVQGGDHVVPGVDSQEFAHHTAGDLFGRDQLHLPRRRDRRELDGRKLVILAGMDVDALERRAGLLAEIALCQLAGSRIETACSGSQS
jgi:hypothetical protein